MNKTIPEIAAEIVEEFALFDDWMDKYQYIIEIGQDLAPLDESLKTDENIVHGCQSQVWLDAREENGHIVLGADSDAIITKGLVGLLTRVLSGHTPEEVLNADLRFVDEIGIREHLSPTRSNGLNSMIKKIKTYALAFRHKQSL